MILKKKDKLHWVKNLIQRHCLVSKYRRINYSKLTCKLKFKEVNPYAIKMRYSQSSNPILNFSH